MRILRLTGEFNPQYPLSGHVADFDWQCEADGTCTGPRPSPGMYFSPITNVNSTWYEFHATSATTAPGTVRSTAIPATPPTESPLKRPTGDRENRQTEPSAPRGTLTSACRADRGYEGAP